MTVSLFKYNKNFVKLKHLIIKKCFLTNINLDYNLDNKYYNLHIFYLDIKN